MGLSKFLAAPTHQTPKTLSITLTTFRDSSTVPCQSKCICPPANRYLSLRGLPANIALSLYAFLLGLHPSCTYASGVSSNTAAGILTTLSNDNSANGLKAFALASKSLRADCTSSTSQDKQV